MPSITRFPRASADQLSDSRPFRPATVGVVGDGVEGLLAALALKEWRPELAVSIVPVPDPAPRSPALASTPPLVAFLTGFLGLDPLVIDRVARPTLSLGTRFEWGETPDAGFNQAFARGDIADAQAHDGHLRRYTVASQLMNAERLPFVRLGGRTMPLVKDTPFSWSFERALLEELLRERARAVGITRVSAPLTDVEAREGDRIERALTADGSVLRFDLWVDASGPDALLVGRALDVPWHGFESSLPTDGAIYATRENGGDPRPYTRIATLAHGFSITIAQRTHDVLGYVYGAAFVDEAGARRELEARYPDLAFATAERFRPGRRAAFARGNVVAIGDSFARVDPLASRGLQMTLHAILELIELCQSGGHDLAQAELRLAERWDHLRWYEALLYRFNRRVDSPFWRHAHLTIDWSGLESTVRDFLEHGPLSNRRPGGHGEAAADAELAELATVGPDAIDLALLGQGVSPRVLAPRTGARDWQELMAMREAMVAHALPQRECWRELAARDTWLGVIDDPTSWCHALTTALTRRWPTRGRSQAALTSLARELGVPALSRREAARMADEFPASPNIDFGKFIKRVPELVLRPKDQGQLSECLHLCVARNLPMRIRAAGHSSGGQTLADEGAVIDLRWLKRIIADDGQRVRVESGLWWLELCTHLRTSGRRPPILIDNWRTSVGGTLAVGGFGDTSHRDGLQIASVRELVLMTLDGTRQRVRPGDDLFDWSLAGCGQLGVITEVVLDTVTRGYDLDARVLAWPSLERFLDDMRLVVHERRFDWLRARLTWAPGVPVAAAAGHTSDGATRAHDFTGLGASLGARDTVDLFAKSVEPPDPRWAFASPGVEVILPVDPIGIAGAHAIARRVVEIGLAPYLPNGSSIMVLPGGDALRFPMAPLPPSELAMMVAIRPELPLSEVPRFLPALRAITDLALEHGGRIYIMGLAPTRPDWLQVQLGQERYQRLVALKRKWDPDGLLNPGLLAPTA